MITHSPVSAVSGRKDIFASVTEVLIEGDSVPFKAWEKFREGEMVDSIMVAEVGPNFERVFLSKTEDRIRPAMLRIRELKEDSFNELILDTLGLSHETMLAQFWQLIVKCEEFLRRKVSIAYIHDNERLRRLWPVTARFDPQKEGWCFDAFSVECYSKWCAGRNIISR